VGASDTQLGVCCNRPDAAACLAPPDAAPAPGAEAGGKDLAPDLSTDRPGDQDGRDLPATDGQPDLAEEASSDLASPLDASPDVAGMDQADAPPPPPDLRTDVPISIDGGPDVASDLGQDGAIVLPVDAPVVDVAADVAPSVDGSPDTATDAPVTAPQIVAIEGTGKTAAIAPRAADLAFWDSHASDRVAATKRISSTSSVLVVTGSNLDSVTLVSLAGQSGQGNHQMSIEEKTMTNLRLGWPSTLTAGGLFVLTLTAATGTATAQVFFLQGEKGDPGDSVFTCSGNDCTATKNLTVSGAFSSTGAMSVGGMSMVPETTRTISLASSMTADQIQAAINSIGRHIPFGVSVTLQFADGTYLLNHALTIGGFWGGGCIEVLGSPIDAAPDYLHTSQLVALDFSAQNSHGLVFEGNGVSVIVQGLKVRVKTDSTSDCALHIRGTYVQVESSYILGTSTTDGIAVYAVQEGEARIKSTYFSHVQVAMRADYGAFIYSGANASTDPAPTHSLYAPYGGTIAKSGSQPAGIEEATTGGEIR
jgi:hypothetical protein